jgi:hypothetical protein
MYICAYVHVYICPCIYAHMSMYVRAYVNSVSLRFEVSFSPFFFFVSLSRSLSHNLSLSRPLSRSRAHALYLSSSLARSRSCVHTQRTSPRKERPSQPRRPACRCCRRRGDQESLCTNSRRHVSSSSCVMCYVSCVLLLMSLCAPSLARTNSHRKSVP